MDYQPSEYGFRYLDVVTGRWMSRDPIGEDGGVNTYCYADNNGNNKYDRLGLISSKFPAVVIPFTEEGEECSVPPAKLVELSIRGSFNIKSYTTNSPESLPVTFWINSYKIEGFYIGPHWAWETCLRSQAVQPKPDPYGEGDIPWGHNASPMEFMAVRQQIVELHFHYLSCECEINPSSLEATGKKFWVRKMVKAGAFVEASPTTLGNFQWSISYPTPSFR